MSKAYIMVRTDLATAAAVASEVTANPDDFTLGTQIVAADGSISAVTAPGTVSVITFAV